MTQDHDDATRRAIEKIEKLLRLSASNSNEAEAASALAKAQELLAAYNLDVSAIELSSGGAGKRTDENVVGGMYAHQRNLWRALAELNFCSYWTQKRRNREGSREWKMRRTWSSEHRIVGRQVNVIATRNMASYLNTTMDRLCRERLGTAHYSVTIAFREGMADRVIDKIQERRASVLDKEAREAAEAVRRAEASGMSAATALTVAGMSEREKIANYDFLNGAGAWQRKLDRDAKWEAEWEERLKRRAAAEAEAERVHAAWATANPEEAAAEEKERLKRQRDADKRASRRTGRRYRFRQTAEEMRRDSGAYQAGFDAGAGISIDQQVDEDKRRIGRG